MRDIKVDARFQKLDVLYKRRKDVVKMHCKGVAIMEITQLSGLSYPTVRSILDRYIQYGEASIKPSARGKKQGVGRILSAHQEQSLRQLICNNLPAQLAMDFTLWDRAAVMTLIETTYGIKLSARSVDSYTRRWGFAVLTKIQQEESIQTWIESEYPIIRQRAKDERAEIHWVTRTACSWPAKFNVKNAELDAASNQLKIVSTNNQNKARWMVIDGTLTPSKFISFLDALVQSASKKVFLIMADLPMLHKKPITSWMRKYKSQLKLVCITNEVR